METTITEDNHTFLDTHLINKFSCYVTNHTSVNKTNCRA